MALKLAHFPAVKELAGFDFEAQPSIDPKQIRDLAASRWIANGENVLLLGPPGVGKTHLSIALGREAILAGYTVQFTTATTLVAGLAKAHGERRLDEKLLALSKPKLLIVDELGYLPLEPDAAHLFFQLVSRRYERVSTPIEFSREWVSTTIRCARISSRAVSQADEITGNLSEIPRSKAEFQGWFAGTALDPAESTLRPDGRGDPFSREVPDEKSLVGRVSVISRRVDRGSCFSAVGRDGVAPARVVG